MQQHAPRATDGAHPTVSRRGFIELVMTAGLGLVATSVSPNIAWADGTGLAKTGVKARFIVGSDIHVQNGYLPDSRADEIGSEGTDSDKKLAYTFEVARQIGGIDAYVFVGDLTDNGYISQYHRLLSIINEANTNNTHVILCQGNHETAVFNWGYGLVNTTRARNRFEDQLKDFSGGQKANDVLDVNGVKIIKLGPLGNDSGDYTNDEDFFVNTALPQITDDKPFFVFSHHQIRETTYTSHEWYGTYTKKMVDAMKAHPNLIHISGHSHATTEDERSIGQDFGFTAIQDGTIGAYYENEKGKVNPESGEGASKPPQASDVFTPGRTVQEGSQCLVVDVNEDDTVKVYRVSLVRTKAGDRGNGIVYLYEPWVINVPAMVAAKGDTTNADAFPYTEARVSKTAPYFDGDAKVEVSPLNNSAMVKFPAAHAGSTDNLDMIHEYKLTATPTAGGNAITKRIFSDYYRPAAFIKKEWEVLFKGLSEKTEYTMSVVAQTSWNKEKDSGGIGTYADSTGTAPNSTSDAIVSAAFTTGELVRPDFALNIDYRAGVETDAKGHALDKRGGQLVDDGTVVPGKTVKVFEADGKGGWSYQLKAEDYEYFADGHMTTELYYKLPAGQVISSGSDHCLFSNQESAGSGFQIASGNLQFWYRNASTNSYRVPEVAAKTGEWVHAVAVADGTNVTLYVNGKQVAQKAAGAMKVPSPKKYYVGCDTNGSGNVQSPVWAGTRIALARVYCRALTAQEVAAAYAAVGGEVKPTELTPLLNVDFRRRSAKDWAEGHALDRSHYSGGTRMDKTLRQPVAFMDGKGGLRYALNEGDYDRLAGGFTTELLFRVPSAVTGDTTEHAIFSAQQVAGSGFEVTGDQLQFWYNPASGDRVVPATTIQANTWYHAVAVADGSNVTLYVDGEQAARAAAGSVKPGPLFYYVGADTKSNGEPEFASLRNTAVAFARVYTGAANADQVADLFKKSGLNK